MSAIPATISAVRRLLVGPREPERLNPSTRRIATRAAAQRIARDFAASGALRLDLGCGMHARKGHLGVDLSSGADLYWDLTAGLPFEDATVDEIRSDHCFEHISLPKVVDVLRACHRVLKPGGVLDFTVPHIDPYLDLYARGDDEALKRLIFDVPTGTEELYATGFDRIAWLLGRDGDHRSLFDRASIVHKVRLAGFENVSTREFDAERDVNKRFSSVYVVAVR